jgi:hypothetical protein
MNVESLVWNCLHSLVADHIYDDFAPLGAPIRCITISQVGGASINYLEGAMPDKRLARMQVNCWDVSRDAAKTLSIQADTALRAYSAMQVEALGEAVSIYEADTLRYGTQQDFTCCYTP